MSDRKTLQRLFDHYGANKVGFAAPYGRLLPAYRSLNPCRILEIGVGNGGSLKAWKEYFDHPQLNAIDIDAKCFENVPANVWCFPGDQSDTEFLARCISATGDLDVIIDDGSHRVDHQQITFEALWPHLRPGGLYVIEDLESSIKELWKRHRRWRHLRNPTGAQPTCDWLYEKARNAIQIPGRTGVTNQPLPKYPAMYSFFATGCFITKGS